MMKMRTHKFRDPQKKEFLEVNVRDKGEVEVDDLENGPTLGVKVKV